MMPRTGPGFNNAWIPELIYSTWAITNKTGGIQKGSFFDKETFQPRIGNRFKSVMNVWTELWTNSVKGGVPWDLLRQDAGRGSFLVAK